MCGRYYLHSPPADVAARFGADLRDNFPPRYNISPTQPIALIRRGERIAREYALARWGFIPGWARGDHLERLAARPLINARGETVAEKPTFRSAFMRRRCLVPANGFYEWQKPPVREFAGREPADAQTKTPAGKQPFVVSRADAPLFAFAGLWETATGPDGGEIDTAAIITVAAGPDLRDIHAREPAIIAPGDYARWLETDERDAAGLADLLVSPPKGAWRAFPVSRAVNSPRNDGPELIAPLAA